MSTALLNDFRSHLRSAGVPVDGLSDWELASALHGARLSTEHAPKGGQSTHGKKYEGGQFIPGESSNDAGTRDEGNGRQDREIPTGTGDRAGGSGATDKDSNVKRDTGRHWTGAENFPDHYRELIDKHISEMPPAVHDYLRNRKPHFQYMSKDELEKAPPVIRSGLQNAAAACLNHGRIIFMEGMEPADKHILQHELVHNAWYTVPQATIDKAVAQAVEDGETLHTLAMRRNVPQEQEYATKRAKRVVLGIKRSKDKQFSLELDLMLPAEELSELGQEAGLKTTDAQYLTLALYLFMAKKHDFELPAAYAQEEVLAYRVMHDDNLAAEVFQHTYPKPEDPRGYQPVLTHRRDKWEISTVGNGRSPKEEFLRSTEHFQKTWAGAVAAANKANAAAGIKTANEPEAPPEPEPLPAGFHRPDRPTQGMMFSRNSDDDSEGHWITIGAKPGPPDGKKHGGSPVFVKGGRIVKGHPSLTNKTIHDIRKPQGDTPEEHWQDLHKRHQEVEHVHLAKARKAHADTAKQATALEEEAKGHDRALRNYEHAGDTEGMHKHGEAARKLREQKRGLITEMEKHEANIGQLKANSEHLARQKADLGVNAEQNDLRFDPATGRQRTDAEQQKHAKAVAAQHSAPLTERQMTGQTKDYETAVWRKKAKKEGIDPNDLQSMAETIQAHDKAFKDERKHVLQYARQQATTKGGLNTLKARAAKGIDADAVKALDDIAKTVAASYPHHFSSHEEDLPGRLFDMLAEGNPQPMTADQAYTEAFDELANAHHAKAQRAPAEAEHAHHAVGVHEAVPFSTAGLPAAVEMDRIEKLIEVVQESQRAMLTLVATIIDQPPPVINLTVPSRPKRQMTISHDDGTTSIITEECNE